MKISFYNENTAKNAILVSIEEIGLDVYFSYSTPVAFVTRSGKRTVRKNDWGTTTGKHLNWIDCGNKKDRVSGEDFERYLKEELKGYALPNIKV